MSGVHGFLTNVRPGPAPFDKALPGFASWWTIVKALVEITGDYCADHLNDVFLPIFVGNHEGFLLFLCYSNRLDNGMVLLRTCNRTCGMAWLWKSLTTTGKNGASLLGWDSLFRQIFSQNEWRGIFQTYFFLFPYEVSEDGVPEVIGLEQFWHGQYDGYHFLYLILIWFRYHSLIIILYDIDIYYNVYIYIHYIHILYTLYIHIFTHTINIYIYIHILYKCAVIYIIIVHLYSIYYT